MAIRPTHELFLFIPFDETKLRIKGEHIKAREVISALQLIIQTQLFGIFSQSSENIIITDNSRDVSIDYSS
jgi:hypothetical protein